MDAITHVLIGASLGIALQRLVRGGPHWGMVGGAAALAPDLDVFVSPLAIGPFYWLGHRGFSHSVIGAPLFGVAVVWLAGRLSRRFKALAPLRWRRDFWLPIVLCSWTQLPLDAITHGGAAVLWPLVDGRVSFELTYWMILWMAPLSLGVLWWRFKGRIDDGRMAMFGVAALAIILVVVAVHAVHRPPGDAYAQMDPRDWITVEPHTNGTIEVHLLEQGRTTQVHWYQDNQSASVDDIRDTWRYRAFRFDAIGPVVIQTTTDANGTAFVVIDTVGHVEVERAPDWMRSDRFDDRARLEGRIVDGQITFDSRW